MYLSEQISVLSSLMHLVRVIAMKGPNSEPSPMILSWKSGMGKFSGSFFSIQAFHWASFLVMQSGNSLKKGMGVYAKQCLDSAMMFNQILSVMKLKGLALSYLTSREAPALRKVPISPEVILLAVVCILKHIISMKVFLSFSNSPLLTYLKVWSDRNSIMNSTLFEGRGDFVESWMDSSKIYRN
jgi:hypothetical protein